MPTTYEQNPGGNGRGEDRDREELMRDSEMNRGEARRSGSSMRDDLDRRTNRDEIDRRHDWRGSRGQSEGWEAGGRSQGSFGRERGDWREGRAYGGGSPGNYGERAFGQGTYGDSGGYGSRAGYGSERGFRSGGERDFGRGSFRSRSDEGSFRSDFDSDRYRGGSRQYGSDFDHLRFEGGGGGREPGMGMGRHAGEGGGFGGYGGGEYGGSYGGIGPGREGSYGAAGSWGGPSGAGSLSGTYGDVSGWEPERMGMRPSSFALHSMMSEEGRGPRQERHRQRRSWEREGPLVRDIMTKDVRTVGPDTSVREAANLMREEETGIIPVCQDGRVMGVITDRDLTMRVLAEGKDINTTKVSSVMSEDIHSCSPDDRLTDAVRIMGEENVRRLPIVDRDDRIKGMLSMTDVAREAEMDYALQEALEQIASRRSFWSRW